MAHETTADGDEKILCGVFGNVNVVSRVFLSLAESLLHIQS